MSALLKGIFISLSLLVAIGPQNSFVLKQGILKEHVFTVSSLCFLCDIVLMWLGVFGVGSLVMSSYWSQVIIAGGGVIFLLVYGVMSLRDAFAGQRLLINNGAHGSGYWQTLLTTLALTLLNPHVYLDTVVIVGGISASLVAVDKVYFFCGALISSAVWFYGVGYGARLLIPVFRQQLAWKILDIVIAGIMFVIAVQLLIFLFNLTGG